MSHSELLKENTLASIKAKESLLEAHDVMKRFQAATEAIVLSYQQGGRLYIAGNGGSAADAQHLAAELVCRLAKNRRAIAAEALTVDSSVLTAIGNDLGYESLFSRQLEAKATPKDIFLAITTSGASANILRALEKAKELEVTSVLFGGRDGGAAKSLADHFVLAPGNTTSTIQEVHMVLYHTLCQAIEDALCPR